MRQRLGSSIAEARLSFAVLKMLQFEGRLRERNEPNVKSRPERTARNERSPVGLLDLPTGPNLTVVAIHFVCRQPMTLRDSDGNTRAGLS